MTQSTPADEVEVSGDTTRIDDGFTFLERILGSEKGYHSNETVMARGFLLLADLLFEICSYTRDTHDMVAKEHYTKNVEASYEREKRLRASYEAENGEGDE